jgi:hypothetical protein
MNNEIVRQLLRLLGLLLVTTQWVPAPVAAALEHPETVAFVTGLISYALADTGWLMSKLPKARKPR